MAEGTVVGMLSATVRLSVVVLVITAVGTALLRVSLGLLRLRAARTVAGRPLE